MYKWFGKKTLKLQFHTWSQVNSNDHTIFFPGKPRLLRDIRTVKKKKNFKKKFDVNRNLKFVIKNLIFIINFLAILQSLLLLPHSKEYEYTFLLFIPSASTEREGSRRDIYSISSLFSTIS